MFAATNGIGYVNPSIRENEVAERERARNAHRTCETEPDRTGFCGTGWNASQIERAISDVTGRVGQKCVA